MSAKFFAILTHQGAARLANAAALGTTLNLTQMAVGDANGTLPVPDPAQTKLLNQKRIAPLNLLSIDPNNASQIIAEQIIPENEGGFWIREIGLYDDAGVLIAVANCPETYKPQLQEGSGRTQTIRMVLIVSSTESVTLKIDPSVVLATRKYADDLLVKHIAETDPHTQYAPKKSPVLTGKPTAPTAAQSDNSTQLATTAFVKTALEKKQPLDDTLTALAGKDVAELLDYLGVPDLIPEEAPFPDVWLPFNDGLQMLAGNGAYDRINIGSDYVELPSRSATFTRASTATYVDKSGVLQTAAINEPRFEKEGLLIEAQSTNMMASSNPQASPWSRSPAPVIYTNEGDEFLRIKTVAQTQGTYNASLPGLTAGTYTCSCWVKIISGGFRFGFEKVTNGITDVLAEDAKDFIKIQKTITITANTPGTIILYSSPAGGASEFIVGRVQVEAQPYATSYIPTAGAAATRARDNWSVPNSGNIPTDNQVSLAVDFDSILAETTNSDYRNILLIDGGRYLYFNPPNGSVNALSDTNLNIPGFQLSAGSSVKKGRNLLALSCDGSKTHSLMNSGPILSSPNTIFGPINLTATGTIKQDTSTIRCINGHIRNLRIWHRALSDAQLRSLR